MAVTWKSILSVWLLMAVLSLNLCLAEQGFGSCPFSSHESAAHGETDLSGSHCGHSHEHFDHHDHEIHHHDHDDHHHSHGHHHHHNHDHGDENNSKRKIEARPRIKLPEELAEEEDMRLYGFDFHSAHDRDISHGGAEFSTLGLWIHAMGCSLLVSMASLICLIILPVIFIHGKPSKTVVDSLAAFGAGAMLGDAFLHQLPHAFGGEHSHSHDHSDHDHLHHHGHGVSHSHSLKDLSVGLSILSGIVLFLLVEKFVRYVEDLSRKGAHVLHGHRHHKSGMNLKNDEDHRDNSSPQPIKNEKRSSSEMAFKRKISDGESEDCSNDEKLNQHETLLHKRGTSSGADVDEKQSLDTATSPLIEKAPLSEKAPATSPSSLVFGYLNLFSDGVHNFTDGMALGSAFLLYGSVGGWSRTLFLLAHELPQEIGDFGILVRSGFSVFKALFFNFLSALVALAGTALALLCGQDPGQSSLIEGFTAGGFIYIAVAGVLPEMNTGNQTFKSTVIQLTSLISGMAVALCISLLE